jgi:hypothetical protein
VRDVLQQIVRIREGESSWATLLLVPKFALAEWQERLE